MPASVRTAQALLNSLLGKSSNFGALGSVPTIYAALSSTDPGSDGSTITEPSTGAYARVSTAASDWNAASSAHPSTATNANAITFPAPSGADWVSGATLKYLCLFDASTSGHFLGSALLTTAKAALDGGAAPSFPAGSITFSMS